MSKKEIAVNLYIKMMVAEENGFLIKVNDKGEEYFNIDETKLKRCIATAGELLNAYDRIVGYGSHKVSE